MYIEDTNILILSTIAIVLIGLLVSRVITNDIKYKHEKGKYKRRHKHYTDLYNKYQDCVQAMQEREELFHHTYYEFSPEFIDRFPEYKETKWFKTEQELDQAIDYHNNIAALVEKRLTDLGLPTDSMELEKRIASVLDQTGEDKAIEIRNEWHQATNKIADDLKVKYNNYAYYDLPYHVNVADFVDGAGDWYHTKTVNVTVDGVKDLLNSNVLY